MTSKPTSSADPAKISRLQSAFFRCLSARTFVISSFLYDQINSNNQVSVKSGDSEQNLISLLSASVYNDIQACVEHYIQKAYMDGQYFFLRQLKLDKTQAIKYVDTIDSSYNIIRTSLLNLVSKSYIKSLVEKNFSKQDIKKMVSSSFANIAMTESMRQKVGGAVDALQRNGITEAQLSAEFETAGDDHVCPQCQQYEGKVMSLDVIRSLIPLHPRCRCFFRIVTK